MTESTTIHAPLPEIEDLIRRTVEEATAPLREEVEKLRLNGRRVLKASDVADELGVTEECVRETYIKRRGLPAFKRGQKYHVYARDLEDFLIGKIGHEETESPNVIPPRHG